MRGKKRDRSGGGNRRGVVTRKYQPTMEALEELIKRKPGILYCHAASEIGIAKQRMMNVLTLMEDTGRLLWEDE